MNTFRIGNRWFSVHLDDQSQADLLQSGQFQGAVRITENLRLSTIDAAAVPEGEKNIVRASVVQRQILRAWNRHPYMYHQVEGETRNQLVSISRIASLLPKITKALRIVGAQDIIQNIDTYLRACERGEHIWDKVNHGYSSFDGFLIKLVANVQEGKCGWWLKTKSVQSVEPTGLMRLLANSFAKNITGSPTFVGTSADWDAFRATADRVVLFTKQMVQQGKAVTERDVVKYLLQFLQSQMEKKGEAVQLGTLYSSNTWVAALPQFLREQGIL